MAGSEKVNPIPWKAALAGDKRLWARRVPAAFSIKSADYRYGRLRLRVIITFDSIGYNSLPLRKTAATEKQMLRPVVFTRVASNG
jgi:hypothetical protein